MTAALGRSIAATLPGAGYSTGPDYLALPSRIFLQQAFKINDYVFDLYAGDIYFASASPLQAAVAVGVSPLLTAAQLSHLFGNDCDRVVQQELCSSSWSAMLLSVGQLSAMLLSVG